MNYILVRAPVLEVNSGKHFVENVWYSVEGAGCCLFVSEGCLPVYIDFSASFVNNAFCFDFDGNKNERLNTLDNGYVALKRGGDNYLIIEPKPVNNSSFFSINYLNKRVEISLSGELSIFINGAKLFNKRVENFCYEGFKIKAGHLVISFTGVRKFVVIIKNESVLCADYYDEANETKEELYFLKRLNDSINHGKVFCLVKEKFDSYLVYLDNDIMDLKGDFVPLVFLDVVSAKNYNYACNLLNEELVPKNKQDIGKFFLEFDNFLPLPNSDFCLLKNGKPVGVAEFKVINNKISNIVIN